MDDDPNQRLRPAFPKVKLILSALPTRPIVAQQFCETSRTSPEGKRNVTHFPSFATICATVPAERTS